MDYNILKTEVADGIAIVTISRPKAMNALNTMFFIEMDALMEELSKNKSVKAIIITGEGKAFVAGADIAEMVNKNEKESTEFSRAGQNTFNNLGRMDVPVIAAINGFALGGGLELAMGCDFRIASTNSKFGQPEANLGLIPGFSGTQRLSRLTGLGNALFLLMTAEIIDAKDAFRIGLVQKVTEPEDLIEETIKIARIIISKSPDAVKKLKKVVREGLEMTLDNGEKLEADTFGTLFGDGKQGKEGMKAFLEKRKPEW